MKKIGILTLYTNNYNYGGILQAYALCKTINDMGNECKVIEYQGKRNVVYSSLNERMKQYTLLEVIDKAKGILNEKIYGKKIDSIVIKRKEKFDDFCRKYVPHTKKYTDENICELNRELDLFVSGSDQVWNPNCALGVFLQDFVEDNSKKVSYAASISRNSLSEHEKLIMIPLINKFKSISVREMTGKKMLEEYGVKDVTAVIDPTMLLNAEKWESVIDKSIERQPYVFCYFFSNSKEYREKINNFCNKKGLKLLYIPYAKQKYNNTDNVGKGTKVNNAGPSEFLSLIKGADYVFTDSFHGLVFSLIFNKKFIIFERDKNNTSTSKNSRIYDLLKLFYLEERLVRNKLEFEDIIDKEINSSKINDIIKNEQEKSMKYLKDALQ